MEKGGMGFWHRDDYDSLFIGFVTMRTTAQHVRKGIAIYVQVYAYFNAFLSYYSQDSYMRLENTVVFIMMLSL